MRRPFLTTPHDSRFAVYLIPPYRVARDIAEIHYMLRKQFGFAAADRLQVHATMKGFFKKNDLPISQLIAGLDSVFEAQKPFWVEISPKFRSDQIGMGLDISNSGTALNPKLMDLRERIVGVVQPFIAEDCDFVKEDLGKPFRGHVTLAFRDIPPEMYDDVLAYLAEAPLPKEPFVAKTFHLLEYFSEDWSGPWWESLSSKLIKSWTVHS